MKTKLNYRVVSCAMGLSLGALMSLPVGAAVGDGNLESGELTQGGRFSDEVQEIFTDALIPIWESDSSILHLNLRGTFLESAEQEVNSGLVFRHILADHDVLLGGNLFYDSRWTDNDNYFDQIGAGVEVLTDKVDFRANYYYPLEDRTQTVDEWSTTEVTRRSTSTRRITRTTTTFFKTFEEAMEGFDVELGGLIPGIPEGTPTRAFLGYYDFDSDFGNSVEGWKVRLESQFCDFFTFDAEWIEDRVLNGTDFFVGFRIHVPLDFWNGIEGRERPDGLPGRFRDMVVRDFRVRTVETDAIVVATTVEETIRKVPPPEEPEPYIPPPDPCDDYVQEWVGDGNRARPLNGYFNPCMTYVQDED